MPQIETNKHISASHRWTAHYRILGKDYHFTVKARKRREVAARAKVQAIKALDEQLEVLNTNIMALDAKREQIKEELWKLNLNEIVPHTITAG